MSVGWQDDLWSLITKYGVLRTISELGVLENLI